MSRHDFWVLAGSAVVFGLLAVGVLVMATRTVVRDSRQFQLELAVKKRVEKPAVDSGVIAGVVDPTDSVRVAGFRERAREIAKAKLEVVDVTWIPSPPRSSLYVLLQKEGAGGVENRMVFHLVSGESPRFGDWARLHEGDVVILEFVGQPRGSVYLGSFAGPQDYLVPGSAAP